METHLAREETLSLGMSPKEISLYAQKTLSPGEVSRVSDVGVWKPGGKMPTGTADWRIRSAESRTIQGALGHVDWGKPRVKSSEQSADGR